VQGQSQVAQGLQGSVAPGKPAVSQMGKARHPPPPPDALKTLLAEPLPGPFPHATAKQPSQVLVPGIVKMSPGPWQGRLPRAHGVPCGGRHARDLEGLAPGGHAPVRLAMPQTGACPAQAPPRLGGAAGPPERRPRPPGLPGGGQGQDAPGVGRPALRLPPPPPAGAGRMPWRTAASPPGACAPHQPPSPPRADVEAAG
jgi:hypothetical protein